MSDPNSWAPNTEQFELGDGEAHVWRAHLNCDEAVLHRLEATLTSDEKARASCFHFPRDRNSFVAAGGVLREPAAGYRAGSGNSRVDAGERQIQRLLPRDDLRGLFGRLESGEWGHQSLTARARSPVWASAYCRPRRISGQTRYT